MGAMCGEGAVWIVLYKAKPMENETQFWGPYMVLGRFRLKY